MFGYVEVVKIDFESFLSVWVNGRRRTIGAGNLTVGAGKWRKNDAKGRKETKSPKSPKKLVIFI
jgi:hypothetical protein